MEIRDELRKLQPNLHLFVNGEGAAEIRGTFAVYSSEGKELNAYRVSIALPSDYPRDLPIVREIGGRIPHSDDYHVNESDGTACVLLPDDRWQCFPEGAPFRQYLDGPLRNFFMGQSLVELGEVWPFGEWGHGLSGILEYYNDLVGTDNPFIAQRYLKVVGKFQVKYHWNCPCGSGQPIKRCCIHKVTELRRKIPSKVARVGVKRIKEVVQKFGV